MAFAFAPKATNQEMPKSKLVNSRKARQMATHGRRKGMHPQMAAKKGPQMVVGLSEAFKQRNEPPPTMPNTNKVTVRSDDYSALIRERRRIRRRIYLCLGNRCARSRCTTPGPKKSEPHKLSDVERILGIPARKKVLP